MDVNYALDALSALANPTRLTAIRLLVQAEPQGVPAGEIGARLGVRQNTMSTHLSILARAGLIRGERDGRSIGYRADLDCMRELIAYLLDDCCDGRPEVCAPLLSALCPPERASALDQPHSKSN